MVSASHSGTVHVHRQLISYGNHPGLSITTLSIYIITNCYNILQVSNFFICFFIATKSCSIGPPTKNRTWIIGLEIRGSIR